MTTIVMIDKIVSVDVHKLDAVINTISGESINMMFDNTNHMEDFVSAFTEGYAMTKTKTITIIDDRYER
jgi:hypothetical protein